MRFPLPLLCFLIAARVCGQETAPTAPVAPSAAPAVSPAPAPVVAAPASPSAGTVEDRQVSSSTASLLSQSVPRWHPQPAAPPPKPADDSAEPEEQPRNHIIRLPQVTVHAAPPPIFREQDLYSKDGLTRLALMRYRGLSIVPLGGMNRKIADEMYREDARLQAIGKFNDTADAIARGGDKAEADFVRSATQSTYQQSLGWGGPVPENPSARGFPGDH